MLQWHAKCLLESDTRYALIQQLPGALCPHTPEIARFGEQQSNLFEQKVEPTCKSV